MSVLVGVLWVVGAALSLGYLTRLRAEQDAWRPLLKTGATLALALIVIVEGGWVLLALALLCSAAGDAALTRSGERPLMFGMAAFGLAHVFYLILFINQEGAIGRDGPRAVMQAATLIAGALLLHRLYGRMGELRLPGAIYAVLVTVMSIVGFGLPPSLWPASFGAALFFCSDALLAESLFGPRREGDEGWRAPLIWILYWGGQAAITAGMLYPRH